MTSQLERNLAKLPPVAYATYPSNRREVIIIKRGETGYYKTDYVVHTEALAAQFVDEMNAKLEVSAQQRRAMVNGSLFGWHVPAADVDNDCNKED